jgi:hypothetical protein
VEASDPIATLLLGLTAFLLLGTGAAWSKASNRSSSNVEIYTALSCWPLGVTLLWLVALYLP